MAHELEIINGEAQMAYVGDVPWHGLGVRVDNNLTPAEMMTAAGLDWDVIERPTYAEINGKVLWTGMKALIRETDHRVLTQVGPDWNPVQNSEAFEFFADFVEAGKMEMHTAGSLRNGELVWALAKVGESFELFNGDKVESFMLFSNPHQYGKSIDVRFTPIRVVCNNTLTLSLNAKAKTAVTLNHRKKFDAEEVKKVLGVASHKLDTYRDMAAFLGSKRTTEDTVREYFGHLLGKNAKDESKLSRTANQALEILHTQPGAEYAEGSWWQPFNAITYMTDHVLGRKNDTRLQSSWYGANQKLKLAALEKAIDFAEAA